jgi:hypothetical protein
MDMEELISQVLPIHQFLFKVNQDYQRLLSATSDEEAVEGSIFFDDHMAAHAIRIHARQRNIDPKDAKLAHIVDALQTIMHRDGIARNKDGIALAR